MTVTDYSTIELTEAEFDEYIDVAYFAISKGTANVSPADKKKLRPLMRHYAKMKHPFAACVRDNRKRFGTHTEEYCAVLKDLIVGSTKWRGKGKKYTPKNLSESFENLNDFLTDELEFENEVPEDFLEYLSQLTDEDVALMTDNNSIAEKSNFAAGEVVWRPERSFDYIRRELQEILNESYSEPSTNGQVEGYSYWVEDIQDGQALVCHKYNDYYIVPFSQTKNGLTVGDEESWIPVEKAWVEANLSEEPQIMAEMFFDGSDTKEEDGIIWKTIMREGHWKLSPGPGGRPINKPITVVEEGESDPKKMVISLKELKENFEAEAKEHVTIPTSHENKVLENTGFIKGLRISKDDQGRATLEAAHDFTEPEVKEKAKRGTIPNVSAGVIFDYVKKETGKKFNAVLDHVALTPSPWLNGMKPFGGVNASDELEIISFSEINESEEGESAAGKGDISTVPTQGGEIVSTLETEAPKNTFFDELGLSEDEVRERLNRLEAVEAENKRNSIEAKCNKWQEEGKSPALVKEAKAALLSDSGQVAYNFSEDGRAVELSLSDLVERLVAASPSINLTEDKVTDEQITGDAPDTTTEEENLKAQFSEEERTEIAVQVLEHGKSEKDAIAKVLAARKSGE